MFISTNYIIMYYKQEVFVSFNNVKTTGSILSSNDFNKREIPYV